MKGDIGERSVVGWENGKQSRYTERQLYRKKEWFHFVCFKCSLSLTHSKIGGSENIPLTEDGPITKDIS